MYTTAMFGNSSLRNAPELRCQWSPESHDTLDEVILKG
jgi:hypothetical protein